MSSEPIAACRVLVSGRVQGVAFRWHSRDVAALFSIGGWVRNLSDGRVELHLEGARSALARMQTWLEHGPPAARVVGLEVREVPTEGASSFEIRT